MRRALIALTVVLAPSRWAPPPPPPDGAQGAARSNAFYKPPAHLHGKHGKLIWARRQTGKDALAGKRSK